MQYGNGIQCRVFVSLLPFDILLTLSQSQFGSHLAGESTESYWAVAFIVTDLCLGNPFWHYSVSFSGRPDPFPKHLYGPIS